MENQNKQNLLLLGADQFHREELMRIEQESEYNIDLSLDIEYLKKEATSNHKILNLAQSIEKRIESSQPKITGVVSYWDFPVTLLGAYLCDKYDFHGPGLESILKCEHKYWARLEQAKCIANYIPNFLCFNPEKDSLEKLQDISLPYWIKPVKSCSSQLAFRVESREQEREAIEKIRNKIDSVSASINFFLKNVERPEEIGLDSGTHCIVEECLKGEQSTVEGYVKNGKVHIYAIFDSINDKYDRSFRSYEYPSQLPREIKKEMHQVCEKMLKHIGFDNSTFNVEFFFDKAKNKLTLLEVNPRISQSHTLPIKWVDGFSNIQLACDLAANKKTVVTKNEGDHGYAGKFYIREYEDAEVQTVPNIEEINALKQKYPGIKMKIPVHAGDRLSKLEEQDSYSYELAMLYLYGDTKKELLNTYNDVKKNLHFSLQQRKAS